MSTDKPDADWTASSTATDSSPSTEQRCKNCGAFVTRDFARVFGDNNNDVDACLECTTATDVKRGGASASSAGPAFLLGGGY